MSRTGRGPITGRAGLTLVEILVVSVIFTIVVLSLFTVLKGAIDSWRKSETLLDMYQNARFALGLMQKEIPAAVLYQGSNDTGHWTKFEGHNLGTAEITEGAASIADEVFFVSPVAGNPGHQDLCEVGYWLRSDNCLMRHFEYFDGTTIPVVYDFSVNNAGTSSDDVIARNVTALEFTYYYRSASGGLPTATAVAWDSGQDLLNGSPSQNFGDDGNAKIPDGLPNAVGVSVTIQSRDGLQHRTFTDFIHMP
ncbi:MAG: hypothetical protein WCY23_01310 [Candidatus Omnitrophota bacterium]